MTSLIARGGVGASRAARVTVAAVPARRDVERAKSTGGRPDAAPTASNVSTPASAQNVAYLYPPTPTPPPIA